jgi:TetR/AcrR family transcriptional regulator, mexJK operon transcriptional repressor
MPDGDITHPKRGRKYAQVLDGARQVFMADGFEGASVDDIARAAGVSKATLYSYFADKRLLFMEVARTECVRQANMAADSIDTSQPAPVVLARAARQMIDIATSDFGRQILRIAAAETARFPALGPAFYESGPATARARLTAYFGEAVARGELAIPDPDLAADQFHALAKAGISDRILFDPEAQVTAAERDRIVSGAVDMFMARYGVGNHTRKGG